MRGIALLEMMIAVAIFSLMMVLVGAILVGGERQADFNDTKIDLQTAVRNSLYQMSLDIRESSPSRTSIGAGGNRLTFQVPASISNSGTITWSAPVTYQIGGNGRQLVRSDSAGSTVLANDVQTINFSFTDASTLTYSVTAQRTTRNGRPLSVTSTGTARFRNP